MCILGLFGRCRADILSHSSLKYTLILQSWSSASLCTDGNNMLALPEGSKTLIWYSNLNSVVYFVNPLASAFLCDSEVVWYISSSVWLWSEISNGNLVDKRRARHFILNYWCALKQCQIINTGDILWMLFQTEHCSRPEPVPFVFLLTPWPLGEVVVEPDVSSVVFMLLIW